MEKTGMHMLLFILLVTAATSCGDTSSHRKTEISSGPASGTDWIRIGPGGGGATFIPTFSYADANRFIIRCDMTGAYLTKDGGSSFSQINYPNGSYSFAFDPMDPEVIYIGSNALNSSSDGGKTWKRIFPAEEEIIKEISSGDHASFSILTKKGSLYNSVGEFKTVRNIEVDPNNSDHLYFSMNNHFFYSRDSGISWEKITFERTIEFIYTNASELKGQVYVFSSNGLQVVDKNTWDYSFTPFHETMQPAFSISGGRMEGGGQAVFYALHNDESLRRDGGVAPTTLWISMDSGKTWEQNHDPVVCNGEFEPPTYARLAASENNASSVYVVASSYQEEKPDGTILFWYGIIKSNDAGKSWKWVWKGGGGSGQYGVKDGKDAPNLKDAWVQKAFGGEYIRLIDIGVAPNNGDIAVATDWYRSMKTMDGGETWTASYSIEQPDGSYSSNGLDVTTDYGVHFDPFDKGHIAISFTDIGYHHSFNWGKSWIRSTNGIPAEWHNTCYWMVFDPDIKGKIWSVWSGLHDFPRGKMTRNPKWTEYGRGGVAVSTDGGRSWTPMTDGIGFDSPSTSIVLDESSPAGNRTLYVAAYGKGVFKSTDDGKTWELRNHGIEGSKGAFELTMLPGGTLFLITSPTPQHQNGEEGREVYMGAVYKSLDRAATWKRLDLLEKTGFPNGLDYDPQNPQRLYLGSWADITLSDLIGGSTAGATGGNETFDLDGGIIMSEDGGMTWTRIFDKDQYVYDVTVDPRHPGRIYCNTFCQGAYRSDDYGKTWKKLKDYDFHWGHRVIVDQHDPEKVYLTTFGSSVWHGTPVVD
jgi:photosystem II stability/assembly factor-like uncharacterized protein